MRLRGDFPLVAAMLLMCGVCVVQIRGGCVKPLTLNNGYADIDPSKTSFPVGTKVRFKCYNGFILASGKSPFSTCRTDSIWSPLATFCQARSCGAPPDVLNGYYKATSIVFGGRVTYYCDKGYDLVGEATQNCTVKGWDGNTPVCDPKTCPDLSPIHNGRTPPLFMDNWEYLSSATYKCDDGFTLIGQKTIICLATGSWSHNPPQCKVVECWHPSSPIQNGWVKSGFGPRYKYRESIIYECNKGFQLFGKDTIECREDNTFEPAPICIPVGNLKPSRIPLEGIGIVTRKPSSTASKKKLNLGFGLFFGFAVLGGIVMVVYWFYFK